MVGCDVTNDRQAKAGPTGVATTRAIDSVEPFEDAVEVATGNSDAFVGHFQLDEAIRPTRRNGDHPTRVAVLHRVVDQVAHSRHHLQAIAFHRFGGDELHHQSNADRLSDQSVSGDGLADHRRDIDHFAITWPTELDPGQLEQVVDGARSPMGFLHHLEREVAIHSDVVVVGQRLGKECQCSHWRLQLVADVGHEVGAHGVDPGTIAEVIDHHQGPTIGQRDAPNQQHLLRRPEQGQPLLPGLARDGSGQEPFDRFLDQQFDMATDGRSSRS